MAQPPGRLALAGVLLGAVACSTQPVSTFVIPVDPAVTVGSFMDAVQANNLEIMGQLWGTDAGPMAGRMDAEQLDMRLSVMLRYLEHESYTIVTGAPTATSRPGHRAVQVELTRQGCVYKVPVELVQVASGWLINNIDLTQAGSPGRPC